MTEMLLGPSSPRGLDPWGERMLAPDEVAAVVRLHNLGWGTKRIAGALGCSRNTVKRYLGHRGPLVMTPAWQSGTGSAMRLGSSQTPHLPGSCTDLG